MYQSKKELLNKALKRGATGALAVIAMGASLAFADGEVEAGIDSLKTAILVFIGLGITAGFALMVASLAPDVGMSIARKWIKKGAK